jgi:hypothetical protein
VKDEDIAEPEITEFVLVKTLVAQEESEYALNVMLPPTGALPPNTVAVSVAELPIVIVAGETRVEMVGEALLTVSVSPLAPHAVV